MDEAHGVDSSLEFTECREEFGSYCRFSTWFVLSVELLLISLLSKEDNSVLFLFFICLLCTSVALVSCLSTARAQQGGSTAQAVSGMLALVNAPADTAWLPYGDSKNCFPTEMGEYYHTTHENGCWGGFSPNTVWFIYDWEVENVNWTEDGKWKPTKLLRASSLLYA